MLAASSGQQVKDGPFLTERRAGESRCPLLGARSSGGALIFHGPLPVPPSARLSPRGTVQPPAAPPCPRASLPVCGPSPRKALAAGMPRCPPQALDHRPPWSGGGNVPAGGRTGQSAGFSPPLSCVAGPALPLAHRPHSSRGSRESQVLRNGMAYSYGTCVDNEITHHMNTQGHPEIPPG